MESQSSFLTFLFLFLFLLMLFLFFAKSHKQKSKAKILVPGPWKLPVLGNLHQLAAARSSLPHHALRELSHKYGPLMHLQLGEISAVVVSSPEIAKEIMKTHDLAFVQRPQLATAQIVVYGSAHIAFAPYGDYWRQMRKICTFELLSAKRVQSFSYVREEEVAKLIESVQSSVGSPINLTCRIFSMTSAIVTKAASGNKTKDQEELLALLKETLQLLSGFGLADLFPSMKLIHLLTGVKAKLEKIHKRLDKILEDVIKENQEKQIRSAEGGKSSEEENLVQVLLRIQKSGNLEIPLTKTNIKAVIWEIFVGGTDTSATILEWAISEMIKNPKVMKKAQTEIRRAFRKKKAVHNTDMEDLSYLKSVIKETLRLHPPGPLLMPRECREPCKINGFEIPIKTKVIVNAWAIGRDPGYWYDAESFIPERFHGSSIDFKGTNFEYIPFGAGRRICPGISFGLANVELPLALLLYHFNWELPNGMKPEDLDMTEGFGAAVGRKDHLYLIPTPYNDDPPHDTSI